MDMKHSIGVKEILLWRLSGSVLWSVICQIFIFIAYLLIINFNISHPVEWLRYSLSMLTVARTWVYLFLLGSITFAQGVICSKDYVTKPVYATTRFSAFIHVLSLRNLFLSTLHVIVGGITSWLYMTLLKNNFSEYYTKCEVSDSMCFTEGYIFLIFSGFWIGFYYFMKEYLFGVKNIIFPVIQQKKFLRVKSSLYSLTVAAATDAILPTFYYLILYYIYGGTVRNYLLYILNLDFEESPLNTLRGLLNVNLIFYTWLFSTLFLENMYIIEFMFDVHLTAHHVFPITSNRTNAFTLADAMTIDTLPIIQHLACMDLFKLATSDKARRSVLFTLSQPGGHPYNWNAVCMASLKIIDDFTSELINVNLEQNKKTIAVNNVKTPTKYVKSLYTDSINSPDPYFYNVSSSCRLRNMTIMETDLAVAAGDNEKNLVPRETLSDLMIKPINNFVAFLCKKPGINYLFGEHPDVKIKFILSKGQPIIWTVQGISLLTTVSLNEDSYGVVQSDLPTIINSLLRLKQILDKISKTGGLGIGRKVTQNKKDIFYIQMQTALKSAVKRSLYNICNVFGPYMNDLPLKPETKIQIRTFLLYKEP